MIKLKSLLKENWWEDLSDKAQQAYIEKHGSAPNVAGDDEKKDKPKKKQIKKKFTKENDDEAAKFLDRKSVV